MTDPRQNEWPYRLLAPGPVPVPPEVLRAMSATVLHHRTPKFQEILNFVWTALRNVYQTRQSVQIITGTGSAAMEAAVVNITSPGDEVLCVVSGKFGERWAEMCERFGCTTRRWNVAWGEALDLNAFKEELKKFPKLKAVFTQACETSTATLHPVREMVQSIRTVVPQALFAVDAITAIGATPLPMDDWDVDIVVAGSQKAFMIPTGLSFIALSERAWAAQAQSTSRKFYFDLATERKSNSKGDSQFSIPTPLIVGLEVVLKRWLEAGSERLWRRSVALSAVTRTSGEKLGLRVYSKAPSPSVTALVTNEDSSTLRDWLERERGITVMGGQDQLKGKILRVGHLGDVRDEDMLALFSALAEKLARPQVFESEIRDEITRQLRQAAPLFT